MEERGDHHRPLRFGGNLFEIGDGGLAALGQHVDAFAAFAHGADQRAQFAVVGQPRGHGRSAFAVMCLRRARGEADGPGLHGAAQQVGHCGYLGIAGGTFGGLGAHDEGAQRGVAGKAGDVGADTVLFQHVEILRKALELPADTGTQRIERHAFDMGEVAHREIAILRLAGGDGEAAIAEHGRRDAECRRGIDERVPGDLGIVVGVAVDDAGREGEASGLDRLLRRTEFRADRGNPTVADAEVAFHRPSA